MITDRRKQLLISLILVYSIILFGCATKEPDVTIDENLLSKANRYAENKATKFDIGPADERDNLFMLLAYSVVYKNWQNADMEHNRGYNIGSVLVNENNEVVYWARNSVNVTKNMTQHGEVRLINCYLANNDRSALKGYTLYTTLEPCAMCSGMMFLTSLPRAVYGQKDPSFGDAIERLEFDSRSLPDGFPPYPRHVISDGSKFKSRYLLDYFYEEYRTKHKDPHITIFLTTSEAEFVFGNALQALETYQVKYKENQKIKEQALNFYHNKVADRYIKLCPEQ